MDFESIVEEILCVEDKETLTLSRNRKKLQAIVFNGRDCLIVGATAESLKRALRLNQ